MNIFQRMAFVLSGQKESQARIASSYNQVGQAVTTKANFAGFTQEGYQRNVMVFSCIQKIAQACASIEWEAYNKRKGGKPTELDTSPLLDLLHKPNPLQSRQEFIEGLVAYLLLTGNSYIEANRPNEKAIPAELWTPCPNNMSVIPNALGYVGTYVYKSGSQIRKFPVDAVTMKGNINHIKTFHPTDLWFGMSPLEAAIVSLDQNNQVGKWNLALLQNSSVPSGVLQVERTPTNPSGGLAVEQRDQLRKEVAERYSGANNAGRPMLLEGGISWQQVSLSPKEMEWLNTKKVTAEDICLIYGVPPEIMGLGKTTYANYNEAQKAFYKGTVLPIMDKIENSLNNWLSPMHNQNANQSKDILCYDRDDIEALNYDRGERMKNIDGLTYITQNEKREAMGYEPKEGWDVFNIGGTLYSEPDDNSQGGDDNGTDTTVTENDDDGEGDDTEETAQTDKQKSRAQWKTFNLLNQNEKQTTLRKINWLRDRFEAGFKKDLNADFKEMGRDIEQAIKSSKEMSVIKYAVQKAVDENEATIKKTVARHIRYTSETFGQNTFNQAKSIFHIETKAKERQWEDWVKSYITKRSTKAVEQIQGTTKTQVRRMLEKVETALTQDGSAIDDIAREIHAEFSNISKSRSTLIARTEVSMASTNSTFQAAKALQLPKMVKTWVSSQDDRTRDNPDVADHLDMNDETVDMDEKFSVPPDADMDCPGDNSAGPQHVCNCRCAIVFASRN